MKKTLILSSFLLANIAHAQEVATETSSVLQDKTFLMLAGGALFLIILLLIKKIMDKKAYKEEENYEDSNL